MPAARSVSAEPLVEISWESQRSVKLRLRNTANMDGWAAAALVKDPSLWRTWARQSPPDPPLGPGRVTLGESVARSLVGRIGRCQPFHAQEGPLQLLAFVVATPGIPAVAAERAVTGDHPVARDDDPDRVPADRATDRPSRPAPADHARHAAVALRPAPWNPPDTAEDEPVPVGQPGQVERQVERLWFAAQPALESR